MTHHEQREIERREIQLITLASRYADAQEIEAKLAAGAAWTDARDSLRRYRARCN